MTLTLILFFDSAVAIYLSCKFFVNGVEWVGQRLKLTQTATGTILAAFGTALPETVVTHGAAKIYVVTEAMRASPLHRRKEAQCFRDMDKYNNDQTSRAN
jgi:hypothetical protein